MNWILGGIGIALLIIGLIGQGFEMRKIRLSAMTDEELSSPKIFMNKKNLKWFILIGVGFVFYYLAEGLPQ